MDEFLKCKNCMALCNSPHECITCGYLYCSNCLESPYCSVCKTSSFFKVSKLARLITKMINNSCKYCNQDLSKINKSEEHKYNCGLYKFKCSVVGCEYYGTKVEIISHVQVNHEKELIKAFDARYNKPEVKISSEKMNYVKERSSLTNINNSSIGINPNSTSKMSSKVAYKEDTKKTKDDKNCVIF